MGKGFKSSGAVSGALDHGSVLRLAEALVPVDLSPADRDAMQARIMRRIERAGTGTQAEEKVPGRDD